MELIWGTNSANIGVASTKISNLLLLHIHITVEDINYRVVHFTQLLSCAKYWCLVRWNLSLIISEACISILCLRRGKEVGRLFTHQTLILYPLHSDPQCFGNINWDKVEQNSTENWNKSEYYKRIVWKSH